MKDVPEIAPEIRGLLEEIVADPRSRMRLAPRRALSEWFGTGETIRVADVSGTKAEKHLIAVHREELAELLREAAVIAYWKAPILAHKPVAPGGRIVDPSAFEDQWKRRSRTHIAYAPSNPTGDLLERCLNGMHASRAHALAVASASLAVNDKARFILGLTAPWDKPRFAIGILRRLIAGSPPKWLSDRAYLHLGARLCEVGSLYEAREAYRCAATNDVAGYALMYSFNLSCFVGDERRAFEDGAELGHWASPYSSFVIDGRDIVALWAEKRSIGDVERARSVISRVSDRISPAASFVAEALAS
jgi:hypothetical protein